MASSFRDLANSIVDGWLARHPADATYLGDHTYDHVLDDPSADSARRRLVEVRGHLVALEGIEVLGPDETVDRAVLRTSLRAELLELSEIDAASWDPMMHNPGQALHNLSFAFAPAVERLASAQARLAAIPDFLAAARDRLGELSRIHTETAVGQLDGTIALIDELLPTLAAEAGVAAPDTTVAREALAEHRAWLAAQVATAARDPRLGADLFAAKLALTLDTDFEPAALLVRAEADFERLTSEIVAAAGRFAGTASPDTSTVRAVLDELADEAPTSDTILAMCRDALTETTAFVHDHELITVYDDPVDIVEMPEIDRGVAGAYCRPSGPLEATPLPTQFAVSPAPADWTEEQVRSFFREDNAHMLHELTVHEAMPGHALQLMHSNRSPGASRARRVFESGSFIEGWAVYAEELMADAGYRRDVSERAAGGLRMQQLKMQLRSTLNAILDIRFHCSIGGGLDEDEAMRLMTERAFQERSEAANKWRRVQLTATQLCTYYVGYCEIRELAADVRAAHPDWTARRVHDAMLSFGSPPARATCEPCSPCDRMPFLDGPGPIAFAHRGFDRGGAENSMRAFEQALHLGYRYLETDVRVSADGIAFAFHDTRLDRVTDRRGILARLDAVTIARARIGGTEPIPRLDDLLAAWPDVRINLDLKEDRALAPTVAAIERTGAVDRVCVGAFSDARVAAARAALGGRLCTSLGPRAAARLRLASRVGRAARPLPGACAQVPIRLGRLAFTDRRLVTTAHRLGLPVHVWTVNEPSDMQRMLDLGVDGIMTDRADLLRDVLQRRGQWVS